MKKKLLGLFVAVAFILAVTVCLTACAGDPELSNIVVSVNNTEYESSYSFGDFEVGTTPSLPYKIYAKFIDGTKKELFASDYTTEYKFNGSKIDALPSSYDNVGEYEIKVGYGGRTLTINFNVVYASRTYQTVLVGNSIWTYGGAQPTIKLNDNTITLEADDYRIIEKSKVADSAALTVAEYWESSSYDKEDPVAPGEYYLFIAVPQVGNYAEAYSVLKEVRVNKANVTVENASTLKVVYSYGSDRQGNIKASDLINSFANYENPIVKCGNEDFQAITWAFAEPNKELNTTNNGETLQLVFTLEEGYDVWYNAPAPIDVALEINKASIQKPIVAEAGVAVGTENQIDIYVGEQYVGLGFDDWKGVNLVITKPDSTKETVDISTESNTHIYLDYKTVAGTYTYTLSLKDKVNYKWSDGTTADVVKEIVVAGSDIRGKHSVFTDWKTYTADGTEVTDEDNEFVMIAENFRASNLGLVDGNGDPVDPADAVPATANADTDGKVSGTCDFGRGTFDQLVLDGEPYYYTYDSSRANTVEMFVKNEFDVIEESSKMVGNLVGNTLTLKMNISDPNVGSDTGLVWVFTFTIVEPQA